MQDGEREQKGWLLSGLPIKLLELQNEGKPSGGIIRTGKCKTSYGRISWTDSARRSAPAVLRAGWPSGSPGMNADQQCCRDRRKKNSRLIRQAGNFFQMAGQPFQLSRKSSRRFLRSSNYCTFRFSVLPRKFFVNSRRAHRREENRPQQHRDNHCDDGVDRDELPFTISAAVTVSIGLRRKKYCSIKFLAR